jgi:hypothetical protein
LQRRSADQERVTGDMREVISLLSLLSAMHQQRHLSDVINTANDDVIRPSNNDDVMQLENEASDALQARQDILDARTKKRQRQCYWSVVTCY